MLRIAHICSAQGHEKLGIVPDYQITRTGLLLQVADAFASNDVATKWTFLGQHPWGALTSLYRAFQLTLHDPEVSRLVRDRQSFIEGPNMVWQALTAGCAQNMLGWDADYIFRLEASCVNGRSKICTSFTSFEPDPALSMLCSPEILELQLQAENRPIGWVCQEARVGDYLVGDVITGWPHPEVRGLIVRQKPYDFFEIVGHVVLHSRPTLPEGSSETVRRECRRICLADSPEGLDVGIRFEIEDYLTFVALRMETSRDGFSAGDLMQILRMSVCRPESSTFATYVGRNGTTA